MGCAVGHGGLTLRAQRWWERRGACLEGAGGSRRVAEGQRAQESLFGGAQRGVALAHGTEASSLPRARHMVTFSSAEPSR